MRGGAGWFPVRSLLDYLFLQQRDTGVVIHVVTTYASDAEIRNVCNKRISTEQRSYKYLSRES